MKSQIKRIGTVLGLPAEIIAHPGVLQLVQAVVAERCKPLTDEQIEAAAKKLSECMDYPWTYMPDKGRSEMRRVATAVIEAAITKGGAA